MSKLDQLRLLGANKRAERAKPNPFQDAARGRDPIPERKQPKAKAGTAGVTGPVRRSTTGDRVVSRVEAGRTAQDEPRSETAGAVAIQKRGRPLAKDADKALMQTKPWAADGVSRATYYRRKAEAEKAGK